VLKESPIHRLAHGHTDRVPFTLSQYSVVRVSAIREGRFSGPAVHDARHPRLGDIGAVLEIHTTPELAYEVECSDPQTGETLWLNAMFPDELEAIAEQAVAPYPGVKA
jgi:hypothetical protein